MTDRRPLRDWTDASKPSPFLPPKRFGFLTEREWIDAHQNRNRPITVDSTIFPEDCVPSVGVSKSVGLMAKPPVAPSLWPYIWTLVTLLTIGTVAVIVSYTA
jgi:hypothetical protein